VIAGTGTVLADDPQLTVRDAQGLTGPQPLRVVIGHRSVPGEARVLDETAPTRLFRTHDLEQVLTELGILGIHHALLEGGPTLAAAFVRAGLVDEVVAYLAPALLGSGTPAVGDLGIATISNILRLSPSSVSVVGSDVRIVAGLHRPDQEGH
ncbi:MAG: RibD family protein, partial [Micropruina sp.]